jgi:hypothetical protein
VPVFGSYDLPGQFAVISQVAARSKVPHDPTGFTDWSSVAP